MTWKNVAAAATLGTASVLAGCATPTGPKAAPATPAGEHQSVATTAIGFYRPHTLAEYPELTPEEMGRRVLKLIDSLNTENDWRIERMREVTELPIAPRQGRNQEFAFIIHLPESGWDYGLNYDARPNRESRTISYGFSKEGDGNDRADIYAMCGMDASAFDAALRGMGFTARPQYDGIGRLIGIDYDSTNKLASVGLGLRPRSYSHPDEVTCVRRLFIDGPL